MWMIAGLLIGLVGCGVGIYFALYAAGFFQYLGGKKASTSAINKNELIQRLLALNDPSKPYHIIKGEDTDLIAEWNIVDAGWYGIFSKNHLSENYRALLLLDEERHSVRCYEELRKMNWSAGTTGLEPNVYYQKNTFGGRILYKKERGKGYGINQLSPIEAGEVYDYNFDINEIRGPIEAAIKAGGWEWVPVTGRKNATFKSPLTAVPATMADDIFCSHCGGNARSDAAFCPNCGAKL